MGNQRGGKTISYTTLWTKCWNMKSLVSIGNSKNVYRSDNCISRGNEDYTENLFFTWNEAALYTNYARVGIRELNQYFARKIGLPPDVTPVTMHRRRNFIKEISTNLRMDSWGRHWMLELLVCSEEDEAHGERELLHLRFLGYGCMLASSLTRCRTDFGKGRQDRLCLPFSCINDNPVTIMRKVSTLKNKGKAWGTSNTQRHYIIHQMHIGIDSWELSFLLTWWVRLMLGETENATKHE